MLKFEKLYKVFKNTEIIRTDFKTDIFKLCEFDFTVFIDEVSIHDSQIKYEMFNKSVFTISAIDVNKKRIYLGLKNQDLSESYEIKVKDLFSILKNSRFKYSLFYEQKEKNIKKMKIEFLLYKDGMWSEERFYCYPYKEYLESDETINRFLTVADAYVEEITEVEIKENDEVTLKLIAISEE